MRKLIGASSDLSVRVNGIDIAYEDGGQTCTAPTILCLHALGHGAGDFRELRARLAGQYRVIALDWPGQGASGGDDTPPTDTEYAKLLAAFIEALDLTNVILVGNSIGGATAIRYAAEHPQRVRALVVANPGGMFARPPGFDLFPRLMARFFEAGAKGAWWFPWAFDVYYNRMLLGASAASQRMRIIAAAVEMAPLLAKAWRGFGQAGSDVRGFAERVACPVLVAWATRDPVNPLWMNRPALRRFRDWQLATFRTGHSPFLEAPDEFVATFESFMNRVAMPRTREAAVPQDAFFPGWRLRIA